MNIANLNLNNTLSETAVKICGQNLIVQMLFIHLVPKAALVSVQSKVIFHFGFDKQMYKLRVLLCFETVSIFIYKHRFNMYSSFYTLKTKTFMAVAN
jgi:hypothetical protein